VYIVSTCLPFIRTACSLTASAGLEPVVLDADRTRGLLSGPAGWGSAVALIIDREFIPEDAVKALEEISMADESCLSENGSGNGSVRMGVGAGGGRPFHVKLFPLALQGVVKGDKYFDSCSDFINMINSAVIKYEQNRTPTQQPPPAVMVQTFSSPCILSERVSVGEGDI